jgi:hypothetical protein
MRLKHTLCFTSHTTSFTSLSLTSFFSFSTSFTSQDNFRRNLEFADFLSSVVESPLGYGKAQRETFRSKKTQAKGASYY